MNGFVRFCLKNIYSGNILKTGYSSECFIITVLLWCWIIVQKVMFSFRSGNPDKDKDVKIVAVDLQAMAPVPGVIQIQGDITKVCYNITLVLSYLDSYCIH